MLGAFYYPPIDFINRNVPASERIMMMGSQMSYDLTNDYIADPSWDSIEWQRLLIRNSTLDEVSEDLKRQGVTHILYSPSVFAWIVSNEGKGPEAMLYRTRGASEVDPAVAVDYEPEVRNWSTFEMYRLKYLENVRSNELYALLRIK